MKNTGGPDLKIYDENQIYQAKRQMLDKKKRVKSAAVPHGRKRDLSAQQSDEYPGSNYSKKSKKASLDEVSRQNEMVTKAVEKALKGTIIVQITDQGKYEDIRSSTESHNAPSNILSKLLSQEHLQKKAGGGRAGGQRPSTGNQFQFSNQF